MGRNIFISHKADGVGDNFGARLCEDLKRMGFSVYFNENENHSMDFPEEIRREASECQDFVLILSHGCLEQLIRNDKIDWVREEIIAAHEAGCNFVPILLDGVKMPKDRDIMPDKIRFLPDIRAISFSINYTISPFDWLLTCLKSHPQEDIEKENERWKPTISFENSKLEELQKRAEASDPKAMYNLGILYKYGLFHPLDTQKSYYWLDKAIHSDDEIIRAHAYAVIGGYYYCGSIPGQKQSFEKAFECREKAMFYDTRAAMELAFMKRKGSGCQFEFSEVGNFYEKIDSGDCIKLCEQAKFYIEYGRFQEAIKLYQKIVKKTNGNLPEASYQLGELYRLGVHTNPPLPDYWRAEHYYKKASDLGHVMATLQLGLIYYNPTGDFEQDLERALQYFLIAAEKGNSEAQYHAAWFYRFGLGCNRDLQKAIEYATLAAAQGHLGAMSSLTMLYMDKDHLNRRKAYQYARQAAEMGSAGSAFLAGVFLLIGNGCTPDYDNAMRLLRYARENGVYEAEFFLELAEATQGV